MIKQYMKKFKKWVQEFRGTPIPPALRLICIKRILYAIIIFIVAIMAAIAVKNAAVLVISIIGIYMLYLAFNTKLSYLKGTIEGHTLMCVMMKLEPKRMSVIFCDEDGNNDVFYTLNKNEKFVENIVYNIYCESASKMIVAYEQA